MSRSRDQNLRQDFRDRGRYAKVNPCYHCGRSAGVSYCSSKYSDYGYGSGMADEGLCLCEKCCTFIDSFPPEEALRRLRLANFGKNPQPRK